MATTNLGRNTAGNEQTHDGGQARKKLLEQARKLVL
jgi:hypothetical protein